MIAELGLAALWLAAGFAALQFATGFAPRLADLAGPAAWANALLTGLAVAALLGVFARIDLSVEAVVAAADPSVPLIYRLAASWAAPAGALLVGAAIFASVVGLAAFFDSENSALARLGGVALALDVAVLIAAPFARADPAPIAGNGLVAALQLPWLPAITPLLAAGGATALAGIAHWPARWAAVRWLWLATAVFAAAMLVASRGGWTAHGDPLAIAPPAALCAAAFAAALVFDGYWRRAGTIVALVGAVLVTVGAAGPVTETERILPLARLTPTAGPGWTAIAARLQVGATTLAPEWRTYAVRGETLAQVATTPGWRSGVAVTLLGEPLPARTSVRVTSAPLLPLVWLGSAILVLGAALNGARR